MADQAADAGKSLDTLEMIPPNPAAGSGMNPHLYLAELEDIAASRATRGVKAKSIKKMIEHLRNDPDGGVERKALEQRDIRMTDAGLVGVALSGGGIRSATFCLGLLQGMAQHGVLRFTDYLSTVSGGGYIGSCWSAVLAETEHEQLLEAERGNRDRAHFPFVHEGGKEERARFQHLRNHANYLAARGFTDYLGALPMMIRGLVVNMILVLPYLLAAAAFTVALYDIKLISTDEPMYATLRFGAIFVGAAILFTIWQSWRRRYGHPPEISEYSTRRARRQAAAAGGLFLIVLALIAFFELQPYAIEQIGLLQVDAQARVQQIAESDFWKLTGGLFAALVGLATSVLGIKKSTLLRNLAFAGVGLVGPVVMWLIYLKFCEIGIHGRVWFSDYVWLNLSDASKSATMLAIFAAGLITVTGLLIDVNVTSLHHYYRDALSKTFIFSLADPGGPEEAICARDNLHLSGLDVRASGAPYHLINATVNTPALDELHLRGRRSDFFTFGTRYCGNNRLGYCRTRDLEKIDNHLNLATAMAISAAAASPHMGQKTGNPFLVFIMALLNIRLGYWLPNPQTVNALEAPLGRWAAMAYPRAVRKLTARYTRVGPFFFMRELLGLQPTKRLPYINVSDGGHIENLGIFELLRRRCRYIIAVDSEADPKMTFNGLATLIRLARTDMGVKIEINIDDLRLDGNCLSRSHAALGKIIYDERDQGELLYIKASVTGSETEYVTEYRAANPDFPHQTTADQFFDEVQFECYRALGYKVADQLFGREEQREETREAASESASIAAERDMGTVFDKLRFWLRPQLPSTEDFLTLQRQRAGVERRLVTERKLEPYSNELIHAVIADLDKQKDGDPASELDPWSEDQLKLFQAVNEQMQLMERTVIRLRLNDPLNRLEQRNRGWMNLFRAWSQSPSFQRNWAISIANYSTAFQVFCKEALGLDLEVTWEPAAVDLLDRLRAAEQPVLDREEEAKLTNKEKDYLRKIRYGDSKDMLVLFAGVQVKRGGHAPAPATGAPPDHVQVGFAVLRKEKDRLVLVSFRVRNTFRGLRLSSQMIERLKLHLGQLNYKRFGFQFSVEDTDAVKVLRAVLVRFGFDDVDAEAAPPAIAAE